MLITAVTVEDILDLIEFEMKEHSELIESYRAVVIHLLEYATLNNEVYDQIMKTLGLMRQHHSECLALVTFKEMIRAKEEELINKHPEQ